MNWKEVDNRAIMRRHAKPELLGKIDESKYLYCHCHCPVDTRYGIKIPIDDLHGWETEYGKCYIHCDNCESEIVVCFPPRTEKETLHGLHTNFVSIDEFFGDKKENEGEVEE